jgi:CheY-like chemotaxis protein
MDERAGSGKIRALFVGWSPLPRDFVRELTQAEPSLSLTVTTRHADLLDILRDGYDCLILDEKKPQIDATRIACKIRNKGFLSLQIIIRRRRAGMCVKREKALGVKVLLEVGKDQKCAQMLAETIKGLSFDAPSIVVRRDGLNAPIGD